MENQQEQQQTLLSKLKHFVYECKIALRVTKKPEKEEFKAVVKAASIGMLAIGLIGFIIQMARQVLFK